MSSSWPTCRHRGEPLGGDLHRCWHPRLRAPAGVTLAVCQQCAAGGVYCDEEIASQATSPASSEMPGFSNRTQPCDYLGPIVERRDSRGKPCRCPGKWLRQCEIHKRCTLADTGRPNVPRCTYCADYTVDGSTPPANNACGFASRAEE